MSDIITLNGYTLKDDTARKNHSVLVEEINNFVDEINAALEELDNKISNGGYTLPVATSSALGGIKTGYTTSGKNYKVQVDSSGNAYVNVPWTDPNTDTNTTYTFADGTNGFTVTPSGGTAQTVKVTPSITSANVTSALGYTPVQQSNIDTALATAKSYTDTAVKNLMGGTVDAAYDTFLELQNLMQADDEATATLIAKVNANTTAIGGKLGKTEKAADSDKLDGQDSSYYLNYNNFSNKPTIPTKTSQLTNDSGYITGYNETDPTVPAWAKAASKPSYSYSEITGKPTLATVATSGNYNDLTNKPTIPAAYSLPLAANGTRGGIQIGYTASGANIPLQLSSEKAYVALTSTAVTSALGYTPLEKTTYEKSAELACGSNGKVCLGKFGAYDTNITIELNSTTSTTYHATIIIHSQNVVPNGTGGTVGCYVYGDADNHITPLITVFRPYGSASRQIEVYANLAGWSKNLVHVQAVALSDGGMTDVLTSVSEIPTTITGKTKVTPVNVLTTNFQPKGSYASPNDVSTALSTAKSYTDTAVAKLVDSSPDTLNTLNELAAALGDDPNFATTVSNKIGQNTTAIAGKLGKTEKAASATVADSANAVAWANVTGKPSSYYTLPTRLNEYSTSGYNDANQATTQGWHNLNSGSANRPSFKQVDGSTGGDYRIMTMAYSNTWVQQIAMDYYSNDVFIRRNQGGTWKGWTALVKMQQGLASPMGTGNAIARWDSSRNATIQDSKVTIDDNGVLNAPTLQENGTALSNKYQAKGNYLTGITKDQVITALGYTPPTTNTTYSVATASTAGLVKPVSVITKPTLNSVTTTAGKYYQVQMSSDGNMFVNVPWSAGTSGSYLPLSGGTITGDVTMQATSNASSANFTWGTVNSNTPYFGYASDQVDGTFVWSLKGTNYASGLAIGGGSGNLLWKGVKVATTNDIPSLSNYSTLANTIKALSISGKTITYTKGDGTTGTLTTQDTNTTYSVATTSANGLMSSTDKSKLDGIATGANNYSLPTASSTTLGGVKTTSTVTSTSGLTACPIIGGVPYYKDTNTTTFAASAITSGTLATDRLPTVPATKLTSAVKGSAVGNSNTTTNGGTKGAVRIVVNNGNLYIYTGSNA